eukprot:TRINITY_DN6286_c0_g1_i3.p2 TRINITY_DN6286_c0_g1~~TRINITY_DN6286_c0_g1_i3.p2  ORF type:complete len:239 (+),score=61.22 TRINITY_DN6286_c0_g1_i3:1417-2133(+)
MSIPGGAESLLSASFATMPRRATEANQDHGGATTTDYGTGRRRGESPAAGAGGGRHTARRAESPRHSSCKSNLPASGMQIFSPTSPTPTSSINTTGIPSSSSAPHQPLPSSARQTWLNNNILNNNNPHHHHHHVEGGSKNGAKTASHVTDGNKNGAKMNNGYSHNNTNQLLAGEGKNGAKISNSNVVTDKTGAKSSSGSIFRAISVGRINNNAAKQHQDSKYYSSTKDGTLCISLLNK